MARQKFAFFVSLIVLVIFVVGCKPKATPVPTPTLVPTVKATTVTTPTLTLTPTIVATLVPTQVVVIVTATSAPTITPTVGAQAVVVATKKPTVKSTEASVEPTGEEQIAEETVAPTKKPTVKATATKKPTVEPTGEEEQVENTAVPTKRATIRPRATATEESSSGWKEDVYENFNNPSSGWSVVNGGRLATVGYYENGYEKYYFMQVWEGGYFELLPDKTFVDVRIEVTAAPMKAPVCYGLIFRQTDDGGYYTAWIGPNGTWKIQERNELSGKLIDLKSGTSSAINNSGSNNLVIEASGSSISFWINGTLISQVEDGHLTNGAIGLLVRNSQDASNAAAKFDDLFVWSPG